MHCPHWQSTGQVDEPMSLAKRLANRRSLAPASLLLRELRGRGSFLPASGPDRSAGSAESRRENPETGNDPARPFPSRKSDSVSLWRAAHLADLEVFSFDFVDLAVVSLALVSALASDEGLSVLMLSCSALAAALYDSLR